MGSGNNRSARAAKRLKHLPLKALLIEDFFLNLIQTNQMCLWYETETRLKRGTGARGMRLPRQRRSKGKTRATTP